LHGNAEAILGKLLTGRRDRLVVATKYTLQTRPGDLNSAGNHRKNLVASLEASLRRLNTAHIDLLWVHVRETWTPVAEVVRALDDQVRAGKVLYVGASDWPAWEIAQANTLAELRGWSPFIGLQVPYNLLERDTERELLPAAEALGLGVAAWSPLAQGILTGKYTRSAGGASGPPGAPAKTRRGEVSERELAVAREVDAVADELGVSSAQVALAWTRARRPWVHPIIGARHLDQLTDNLGGTELELPAKAIQRLDEASPVTLGFPHDFIAQAREFVYGPLDRRFTPRG
jgi:aryl-alcohol dehydrogenase-like predicted oxidoreductase